MPLTDADNAEILTMIQDCEDKARQKNTEEQDIRTLAHNLRDILETKDSSDNPIPIKDRVTGKVITPARREEVFNALKAKYQALP